MELPPELTQLFNRMKTVLEPRHLEPLRNALQRPLVCEVIKTYLTDLRHLQGCDESLSDYHTNLAELNLDQKYELSELQATKIKAKIKESSQYRQVLESIYGETWARR